jgi:hypothetical protein
MTKRHTTATPIRDSLALLALRIAVNDIAFRAPV